jgi:uncharacterized protein (DUF2384 family)
MPDGSYLYDKKLLYGFSELHGQSPLTLLDTTTGFAMVHTVLGRIEHGIYA